MTRSEFAEILEIEKTLQSIDSTLKRIERKLPEKSKKEIAEYNATAFHSAILSQTQMSHPSCELSITQPGKP